MIEFLRELLDVLYHDPNYGGPRVEDIREFIEFARRLALPYYEEARLYWPKAEQDGFFDGANEIWIYLPITLEKLVRTYGASSKRPSKTR